MRATEWMLSWAFVLVISTVPVLQIILELARGERAQCVDVFRARPTAKGLRHFEQVLEDKSWLPRLLRPLAQRALFTLLREPSGQVIVGRNQWLFYEPDVRYLVEPDPLEPNRDGSGMAQPVHRREHVVRAIVHFRDQLKERGLELLVVPVPGKASVYPDLVTARGKDKIQHFSSPTALVLAELRRKQVETVDLFACFREARQHASPTGARPDLYLARDTHWTPAGVEKAAQVVARKLTELGWLPPMPMRQFQSRAIRVRRWGDVLELMQIPSLRRHYVAETVECRQVVDPDLGPMIPTPSDRPGTYRYPARKSPVLVLGDSFCRIYQLPEPASLGEPPAGASSSPAPTDRKPAVKRLLPGSAGFIALLAQALRAPVDALVSDGGASTDVRQQLSTNAEILEGKKVVIWEFVERDIALGQSGWQDVALPVKLD